MPHHARYYEPRNERAGLVLLPRPYTGCPGFRRSAPVIFTTARKRGRLASKLVTPPSLVGQRHEIQRKKVERRIRRSEHLPLHLSSGSKTTVNLVLFGNSQSGILKLFNDTLRDSFLFNQKLSDGKSRRGLKKKEREREREKEEKEKEHFRQRKTRGKRGRRPAGISLVW